MPSDVMISTALFLTAFALASALVRSPDLKAYFQTVRRIRFWNEELSNSVSHTAKRELDSFAYLRA